MTSQPVDRARERRACVDVHTRGHQLSRLQVQGPSGIPVVGAARAPPSVGVRRSAGNLDARLRGATRCDDTGIGRDAVSVIIVRVQPVDAAAAKLCWLAIADKGWGTRAGSPGRRVSWRRWRKVGADAVDETHVARAGPGRTWELGAGVCVHTASLLQDISDLTVAAGAVADHPRESARAATTVHAVSSGRIEIGAPGERAARRCDASVDLNCRSGGVKLVPGARDAVSTTGTVARRRWQIAASRVASRARAGLAGVDLSAGIAAVPLGADALAAAFICRATSKVGARCVPGAGDGKEWNVRM